MTDPQQQNTHKADGHSKASMIIAWAHPGSAFMQLLKFFQAGLTLAENSRVKRACKQPCADQAA